MFFGILNRTIFGELARVFLMSLLGITGILLMAGIVAEATQHGLGPGQILAVIPLIIPSTLPYTIPATTLFATCVVYGRLSHDNEIIAIKAAGINLLRVIWPGVFLGLAMSGVTLALYVQTIPETHHLMRSMFLNDVEELLYSMLKRDRCINQPRLNYVMFVHGVQGRKLQDAIFKRRDGKGHYDVIARAAEAELHVNAARKEVEVLMRRCFVISDGGKSQGYFNDKKWPVALPPDFGMNTKIRASDLTWDEIWERRDKLAGEEERIAVQIALVESRHRLDGPAPGSEDDKNLKHWAAYRKQKQGEIRSLDAELHMRPSLALGCLCFVLVGCPVGIWFSRSDYLSAFITCFLPIVFVYYPLLLCGTNFAKSGAIPPYLSLWVPNAVMAVVALGLFRRLLRH